VTSWGKFLAFSCSSARHFDSFRGIDAIDRKILAELQVDGRLTLTELSERVRLSLSRCQRRVRELERGGVIRGYHAQVDPARIGFGFEVLVFATLSHPDVPHFDAAVQDVPQIIEAQRLFGEPDYLLRVVAADLAAYQRFYEETLIRLPGVERISSTIVMKQVVATRPLPEAP
jgi:DNA-binding Lrp family transcriptional regulator